MNKRRQDFELLQRFARHGEQSAFADVVRRHLDLVFATALRKVEDSGAAQEIAQNVFAVLARKAWRFAPDDSLPAWLHKTALLESKSWLRGDLRRRRREETAAELGTTMKASEQEPAFTALVPLLDEALLSLRERDRTALLLRYYESQSLREVGTAVGVSEDTAQKRVQSALEKLAHFFKRHGFKSATVPAAAAALQSTAATTSAAMASTVVSAALQVAPPTLVGLGAILARLASLSRVQTAAVCVALAAVPVGIQLNERHATVEELKRIQIQLLAAQNEHGTLQAQTERLRASAGRLEQSVAEANEAAARAAESARAFDVWKQKTRNQLMAADYRWDDDSAFVRISKPAAFELARLSSVEPIFRTGVIPTYARELMCLTASERQSLEATLHRHMAEVAAGMTAAVYATNMPSSGRVAGSQVTNFMNSGRVVASRLFVLPGLGADEAKQRGDKTLAELRGILGEERWPLVQARFDGVKGGNVYSGGNALAGILHLSSNRSGEELFIWVETNDQGTFKTGSSWAGYGVIGGWGGGELSRFLPEGDPNRTDGSDDFGRTRDKDSEGSNALHQRALAWLQEQATTRLGKGARP